MSSSRDSKHNVLIKVNVKNERTDIIMNMDSQKEYEMDFRNIPCKTSEKLRVRLLFYNSLKSSSF